jgi:hypothetical protein
LTAKKNSTAPTPLLEVGAGRSAASSQRRACSLVHTRRRFRRWVYFGLFRKLFGRIRGLQVRTKAFSQMRGHKE